MMLKDIRSLQKKYKVELLELAAITGLPEAYLKMIDSGEIKPLETDLKRMEEAFKQIAADPERMQDLKEIKPELSDDDIKRINLDGMDESVR